MRRHEIPTHLETPDRFVLGLTSKQAMQLMAAAAGTYGLLDNHALAPEVRYPLAALGAVASVLMALIRPGGRPLEEWGLLLLFHLATPRQMVWRPCQPAKVEASETWSKFAPRVGWTASDENRGEALHAG